MGRPCICCLKASSSSSGSSSSFTGSSGSGSTISSSSSSSSDTRLCLQCCPDFPQACSTPDPSEIIDCTNDQPPSRQGRCTCVCECEVPDPAFPNTGFVNCFLPFDNCAESVNDNCTNVPELRCFCPLEGNPCDPDDPLGLAACEVEDNPDNEGRSLFMRGATGTEDTGTSGPTFFIEGVEASEGPNLPSTGTTGTLSGSSAGCHWTSPGNITTDNGTGASGGACTGGGYSQYLKSQGHSFSIPTGATIDGIEVRIERQAGATRHTDRLVQVTNGDGAGGYSATNLANGTSWNTTGVFTYGGPTELWGETWTPAKINGFLFGAAVSVDVTSSMLATTVECDFIDIKVYYTP